MFFKFFNSLNFKFFKNCYSTPSLDRRKLQTEVHWLILSGIRIQEEKYLLIAGKIKLRNYYLIGKTWLKYQMPMIEVDVIHTPVLVHKVTVTDPLLV